MGPTSCHNMLLPHMSAMHMSFAMYPLRFCGSDLPRLSGSLVPISSLWGVGRCTTWSGLPQLCTNTCTDTINMYCQSICTASCPLLLDCGIPPNVGREIDQDYDLTHICRHRDPGSGMLPHVGRVLFDQDLLSFPRLQAQ
jgi:hypothetical protein